MGDQDSVEGFERRFRGPHVEWSEATSWVAMDAILLSVAEEQTRHHDAMMADPAVGEMERSWRAVGYAGAAILLAFAAMEGHLNFQCRRWLADTLAGDAARHPADLGQVDHLVELLWETMRSKRYGGRPGRNLGQLERRLTFKDKWELLYRIGPAGETLNPQKPPLEPLLKALADVEARRNHFLAHPKLRPVTARAAKERGTGSRIVWGPPDPRLFVEIREITIDVARDAVQAVKETIELVCEATGDQLPWDHNAEAGGFLRRTVSDL